LTAPHSETKNSLRSTKFDLRVRKSGVNGAAGIAWPAAYVQNPASLVDRKWNHCGEELQRGRLGGTLLRVPQIEPCVEILAAKFILDLSQSRDCQPVAVPAVRGAG